MVLARLLLLLIAAGAVVAGVTLGTRSHPRPDPDARYACPMHPEVVSNQPSQCSICGMALEPLGGDASGHSPARGGMMGMPDLTAVENVRKHKILDVVRMQSLLPNVRELRGAAWVEPDGTIVSLFYKDQIQALALDETGVFSPTRAPQATFSVRRIAEPAMPWGEGPQTDRSLARVRFRAPLSSADDASIHLRPEPGQVGWVQLPSRAREVLTVPAASVLHAPEGPYVLASIGGFRFEKRPIEIGEIFLKQGFAVVLSGLRVQDRVVSRATFFLDADRRLAALGER